MQTSEPRLSIKDWRKNYLNEEEPFLLEEKLESKDPFVLFDKWLKNVASKTDVSFEEVNAACFSTVSNSRPRSRMVLVKDYDAKGFSFYTNYQSDKGKELEVRIEGKVEQVPMEIAVEYWNSRPLKSRIGSKCSEQSQLIPNRQYLIDKRIALEELANKEGPNAITKPDNWGGYCLIPDYFEFWQGQSDRLHDRLIFEKGSNSDWKLKRLSP